MKKIVNRLIVLSSLCLSLGFLSTTTFVGSVQGSAPKCLNEICVGDGFIEYQSCVQYYDLLTNQCVTTNICRVNDECKFQ